ncbi:PTS mannose/fructose/sorbose transporter subunit IIC [Lacticaseibacillus rhamnosus]|uniref:PTS mannose/fructose/sorbose transporter subunit IIC n=1 Tax=Lacticaseibacillus rhamnosus TaxID=47715 RepID=UPI00242A2CF2|nr:PTS mannose/fructose/sorbose transporter subunit IIC [Lacticaseibacillus rhamnosus]GMB73085.1 PTS mannose/fructose/sorbose transporter subunit IIC [Lacticaseibacillus rhamnosus]
MAISTIQIILIFIWSSVVGMGSVLDEFQTHRPLIACSVMGLILGDPKTGIILGGTLELIALGWMNIGAAQSPDSALASTISTILVIVGNQDIQKGIAIALPVASAGQVLTVLARTVTVAFQHAADREAEKANFTAIIWLHFTALIVQALRVSIPTTIVAVFVSPEEIKSMLDALPQVITGGLTVAGGFIVVVGYAMILNMMSVKYLMPFFYLGFVLGGYLKLSLLAWGAVGLIFAIIYVQLNPKFAQNHSNGSGSSGGAVASAGDHPAELPEDELDD